MSLRSKSSNDGWDWVWVLVSSLAGNETAMEDEDEEERLLLRLSELSLSTNEPLSEGGIDVSADLFPSLRSSFFSMVSELCKLDVVMVYLKRKGTINGGVFSQKN